MEITADWSRQLVLRVIFNIQRGTVEIKHFNSTRMHFFQDIGHLVSKACIYIHLCSYYCVLERQKRGYDFVPPGGNKHHD